MTKEIIVIRPGPRANFDSFYLLWAMTLKIVKDQWRRIIFMQTNREDVGKRYYEVEIPVPPDTKTAESVSADFRDYYRTIAAARTKLQAYLASSKGHHFFVSGAEEPGIEGESDSTSGDILSSVTIDDRASPQD
jgi:type I restriction enzyme M protein